MTTITQIAIRSALVACGLLVASGAHASAIVNGGFEDADLSAYSVNGDVRLGRAFTAAPEGNFVGQVDFNPVSNASGSISQSFTLASAGSFALQFYLGRVEYACACNDVPLTFGALVDGTTLTSTVPPSVTSIPAFASYLFYNLQTDLSAGAHTLTFAFSRGDTAFGRAPQFLLDGVQTSFTPAVAGVPEPSAWALLILGFGAVGAGLRRQRALAFA